MNFVKNNWQKFIVIAYVILLPGVSFAVVNCDPTQGKICPTIAATSIPTLIHDVLIGALKIGIPIVALAIIYSGFLFVFARGNEEKLKTAKDALLYSVIGAAILLGSWAIAEMIQNTVTTLGQ